MDVDRVVGCLKILANTHRANIIRVLHGGEGEKFAEIMERCGLDPKSDCGTFGYHLSTLVEAGVVRQDHRGLYYLTEKGEAIWSLIQQILMEGASEAPVTERAGLRVTRFGEEDIGDYARFIHERVDQDASSDFVETVARYNNFVDGPYGSFDDRELRTHSYIARSLPGGDVVGAIFGHTTYDPFKTYPLYGERRLTLRIEAYSLDPDADRKRVLTPLLEKMVNIANREGYNMEMDVWNAEKFEMEVFKNLGLKITPLPRIYKVHRLAPDWKKDHTIRKLKVEGFNKKLIDLIAGQERFTLNQASKTAGITEKEAKDPITRLVDREVLVEKEAGWALAQKYRTPTRSEGRGAVNEG